MEGKVAFVAGFLRLSYANSLENLREAVRAIAEHAGADAARRASIGPRRGCAQDGRIRAKELR